MTKGTPILRVFEQVNKFVFVVGQLVISFHDVDFLAVKKNVCRSFQLGQTESALFFFGG
jgi:hypothetical protein